MTDVPAELAKSLRDKVYTSLSAWTFARVSFVRPSRDPSGDTTYFFGTAVGIRGTMVDKRIRFVSKTRKPCGVRIMAASVLDPAQEGKPERLCSTKHIPREGDIIVGVAVDNTFVPKKPGARKEPFVMTWWAAGAGPIQRMLELWDGTPSIRTTPSKARRLLSVSGDYDDLWALTALAIFGKLSYFVNEARDKPAWKSASPPTPHRFATATSGIEFAASIAREADEPRLLHAIEDAVKKAGLPPSLVNEPRKRMRVDDKAFAAQLNNAADEYVLEADPLIAEEVFKNPVVLKARTQSMFKAESKSEPDTPFGRALAQMGEDAGLRSTADRPSSPAFRNTSPIRSRYTARPPPGFEPRNVERSTTPPFTLDSSSYQSHYPVPKTRPGTPPMIIYSPSSKPFEETSRPRPAYNTYSPSAEPFRPYPTSRPPPTMPSMYP